MAKKAKKAAKKPVKKAAAKSAPKRVEAIPQNQPQLTPFFSVTNAMAAVDFYKQVLGAKVLSLMNSPDGKVAHCSLKIGNSVLMLAEPMGPSAGQSAGMSSGVMIYVKDAHAVFNKAVSLGAKTLVPVADMFWGDRWGMLQDPFGNVWQIATHIEDVKPAEMAKRAAVAMSQPPPGPGTPPPPPPEDITSEHIAQA
jgi:PhnB protein